jgi:hypothetical protein
MAPPMAITRYLSPSGELLDAEAQIRLLEIGIRAFHPLLAMVPGGNPSLPIASALHKAGYDPEAVREQGGAVIKFYPQMPDHNAACGLYADTGGATIYVCGVPEAVLPCCASTDGLMPDSATVARLLTDPGLLAFAYRQLDNVPTDLSRDGLERGLTLAGFVVVKVMI